jgi:hypothetical protein
LELRISTLNLTTFTEKLSASSFNFRIGKKILTGAAKKRPEQNHNENNKKHQK